MGVRRSERSRSRGTPRLLVLGSALWVSSAFAQTSPISTQSLFFSQASNSQHGNHLDVQLGSFYTDNVYLEPGGPGATLVMLGLVGDLERIGTRLDYTLVSDLSVVKYLGGQFQTQPLGYLDGTADVKIVPGFFSWTARETYSQVTLSASAPITPDNLEALNFITTGPRLTFRPTLRTTVAMDATYSYVSSSSKSAQYVNIDNQRYAGDLKLSRAFSSSASAYLMGVAEKIQFEDTVNNTDFRDWQALAGYRLENARTLIELSGGYQMVYTTALATIKTVIGLVEYPQEETTGGGAWKIDLSRLIRPTQRVSLHTLKLVTDAASLFRLNIDQPVPSTTPIQIVSGEPLTYKELGATWRFEENRTAFQIDLKATSQHYQVTPSSNVDSKIASALFARQLGPTLNWDIGASYEHDDYTNGGLVKSVDGITDLRWRLGPRLSLRLVYAYYHVAPRGYAENQVGLVASYGLTAPKVSSESGTQGAPPSWLLPTAPASSQLSPPLSP